MKKLIILLLIIAGLLGLYVYSDKPEAVPSARDRGRETFRPDPTSATFIFDDGPITLSAGRAEKAIAPESAITEEVNLNETIGYGDINADGREDAAVVLVRAGGGSGLFVYVAALVSSGSSYKGTNALYIGDRIVPQELLINGSRLTVKYLDRSPSEPLAAEPTLAQEAKFTYRNGRLE